MIEQVPPSRPELTQRQIEDNRIKLRRETLGLESRHGHPRAWAIALSGGGIRSATFALGVLQAMARAPALPINGAAKSNGLNDFLLPHFDYLSTVSGGGYIGAFFTSLFVPHRLSADQSPAAAGTMAKDAQENESAKAAAQTAYATFRFEPPGRIHTTRDYSANPGEGSMAWLRENGRYLLPSGAGDFFYALALTLRNLLSVHFVVGMPLLLVLSLLALLRLYVNALYCDPGLFVSQHGLALLLCNSLWWMPVLWTVVAAGPLVLAFWMVYSFHSQEEQVKLATLCTVIMSGIGAAFLLMVTIAPLPASLKYLFGLGAFEIGATLLVFLTLVFHMRLSPIRKDYSGAYDSIRNYRVRITRLLAGQLTLVIAMIFIATVTSLTEWLYGFLQRHPDTGFAVVTPPLLIAAVRMIANRLDDKSATGWIRKLPPDVVAGMVGFTILLSVAVLWGLLVAWVQRDTSMASLGITAYCSLGILAAAAAVLTATSGQFIGFINLSSLQAFYSSRLARAYLGASNGQRFKVGGSIRSRRSRLSVADTMEGDDLKLDMFYGSFCAPIHLINVTLNLTVDPAEQLVQRDRKGKPLCLAPGHLTQAGSSEVSYILDGEKRTREDNGFRHSEINQALTVSYWIATSGAALTTGLGRATSLGASLALGLSNVRLGTWWPCDFTPRLTNEPGYWKLFKTHAYLLYEFTAHFHGLRREYQYLSDGGHFENTAAYELIRVERDIELIVLCDSGCDVHYTFEDISNLTRLARIDQSLEIEVDTGILEHPELRHYFGNVGDFKPCVPADQRCALLLNVFRKDGRRDIQSRILVLKPRVILGVPNDVCNYARQHPDFPNESTAKQFFNEAQFESYRQLGLNIGQLLFGDAEAGHCNVAQALWSYLWPRENASI